MRWMRSTSATGSLRGKSLHSVFRLEARKQKGAPAAPLFFWRNRLAEAIDPDSATNFSQLSQRKFNDFFFRFNDLLNDLLHDFLRPLRSFLISGEETRFSADWRVDPNVNVSARKRQAPTLIQMRTQRTGSDF